MRDLDTPAPGLLLVIQAPVLVIQAPATWGYSPGRWRATRMAGESP